MKAITTNVWVKFIMEKKLRTNYFSQFCMLAIPVYNDGTALPRKTRELVI